MSDFSICVGSERGLSFQVVWDEARGSTRTAAEHTRGRLQALLCSEPIWQEAPGVGVEWTWVELLEHLSESWPYVIFEEDLDYSAYELRDHDDVEEESEFLDSHDLAVGLQGIWLPRLLVVRSGRLARVESHFRSVYLPWNETLKTLEDLGDLIATRLKSFVLDDRGKIALAEWSSRSDSSVVEAATIFFGVESAELIRIEELVGYSLVDRKADYFEPSTSLAAARLAYGSVYGEDWKALLRTVTRVDSETSPYHPCVDELSRKAREALDECQVGSRPHSQAHQVVSAIRGDLPTVVSNDSPIQMTEVFSELGIPIENIELTSRSLDAVAVWPRSGVAAVIVNSRGEHARGRRGRNATLAHELCHILLDRHRALSLVEVNGGRVPKALEKRARAFAAELLVPPAVLRRYLSRLRTTTTEAVVDSICRRYHASREIVAWQLLNKHSDELDYDVSVTLRRYV